MAFHNPYHFVPVKNGGRQCDLSKEDFKKENTAHVTHDRYTKNTYSGRVTCQLTAETAFVVGDNHIPDETDSNPTKVVQYKLDELPAIPATTIRGLISNIVETASNSSLRVLENETYSYRKKAEEALQFVGMIIKPQDNVYKLLPLCFFEYDRQQREMESVNCIKVQLKQPDDYQTFTLQNKKFYYIKKTFENTTGEQPITEEEFNKKTPYEKENFQRGFLRIMRNSARNEDFAELPRKYELFIFWNKEDGEVENAKTLRDIFPEAVHNFHKLADLRTKDDKKYPFEPVGTKRNNGGEKDNLRLKTGDLVYYKRTIINGEKFAAEISFSSIWRDIIGKEINHVKKADTTFDFFREIDNELLPFNSSRKQITLAEQMFGFVENNGDEKNESGELSLAGRIYPSAARFDGIKDQTGSIRKVEKADDCYDENPTTDDGWTLLKILANPKTPSPAMYFKSGYIAKNQLNAEDHEPQGRKFYLHNNSNEGRPWETRKPAENLIQKMKVKPVRKDSVFSFHIDFENLSRIEIGALLYALRPNAAFRHKIGLGKPIGLGTVKIDITALSKIDRANRYSGSGLFEDRYANIDSEIDALQTEFRQINPDICDILEAVGDPNNIRAEVHYPKISGKTDEEENFLWFAANDATRDKKGNKKIKFDRREHRISANNFNLKPVTKDKIEPLNDIQLG